jgi:hypothetical protein
MMVTRVELFSSLVIVHNLCVHCRKPGNFILTHKQYDDIVNKGMFIQDVFPELNADEREFMISGTHPACWDEMFK